VDGIVGPHQVFTGPCRHDFGLRRGPACTGRPSSLNVAPTPGQRYRMRPQITHTQPVTSVRVERVVRAAHGLVPPAPGTIAKVSRKSAVREVPDR
jgi:hypothetical protein